MQIIIHILRLLYRLAQQSLSYLRRLLKRHHSHQLLQLGHLHQLAHRHKVYLIVIDHQYVQLPVAYQLSIFVYLS